VGGGARPYAKERANNLLKTLRLFGAKPGRNLTTIDCNVKTRRKNDLPII